MKIPILNELIRVFVPVQLINESDEFSEKLRCVEPSLNNWPEDLNYLRNKICLVFECIRHGFNWTRNNFPINLWNNVTCFQNRSFNKVKQTHLYKLVIWILSTLWLPKNLLKQGRKVRKWKLPVSLPGILRMSFGGWNSSDST